MRGITIDTNDGIFEGQIMVYVNNAEHLTQLVKKLKAIMGVVNVFRFDS
jgi:GTP pyrophosphokinase